MCIASASRLLVLQVCCYLSCRYREKAEKTAAGFAERLQEMALAMPQMCCALYLQALGHPRQVCCALASSHSPEAFSACQVVCINVPASRMFREKSADGPGHALDVLCPSPAGPRPAMNVPVVVAAPFVLMLGGLCMYRLM